MEFFLDIFDCYHHKGAIVDGGILSSHICSLDRRSSPMNFYMSPCRIDHITNSYLQCFVDMSCFAFPFEGITLS